MSLRPDPGARGVREFYPQRDSSAVGGLDRMVINALGHLRQLGRPRAGGSRAIVMEVQRQSEDLVGMSDPELTWQARALRPRLRARGFGMEPVARAFALVRELAGRRLGTRHRDAQLAAGWALLHGAVAELPTGAGKSLAATLPACTVALAGIPVHVVTASGALAGRDALAMAPIYEGIGLGLGSIDPRMSVADRRAAYRRDVTYVSGKEIAFDYLRDRLELGRRPGPIRMRLERLHRTAASMDRLRLQGLFYAVVDDADTVLIDEARTPLIVSGPGDSSFEAEVYRRALELAGGLESGEDFSVDFSERTVELSERGMSHLAELAEPLGGIWTGRNRREELVSRALAAKHLHVRDKHYTVIDERVHLLEEGSGRVMRGRALEGGLHQLIEAKEDCPVTAHTEILGRLSPQRFFRRYLALAGLTATARESASEFWSVYRLKVVTVPGGEEARRGLPTERIFRTADEKLDALVGRVGELNAAGSPVLLGARSPRSARQIATRLEEAGFSCEVAPGAQSDEEAALLAGAGEPGRITVAANLAGRGVRIRYAGDGAGLAVIATERHDSRRLDRQLRQRAGAGTYERFASLEDELLQAHPVRILGVLGPRQADPGSAPGRILARALVRRAQRKAERRQARIRRDLMRMDETTDTALAFSGSGE